MFRNLQQPLSWAVWSWNDRSGRHRLGRQEWATKAKVKVKAIWNVVEHVKCYNKVVTICLPDRCLPDRSFQIHTAHDKECKKLVKKLSCCNSCHIKPVRMNSARKNAQTNERTNERTDEHERTDEGTNERTYKQTNRNEHTTLQDHGNGIHSSQ